MRSTGHDYVPDLEAFALRLEDVLNGWLSKRQDKAFDEQMVARSIEDDAMHNYENWSVQRVSTSSPWPLFKVTVGNNTYLLEVSNAR